MIALPLWLTQVACINTIRFPPDLWGSEDWRITADTGRTNGTTQTRDPSLPGVARVFGGCNGADASWAMITSGWASRAELVVYRRQDFTLELHPMQLIDVDPGGAWDRWEVSLTGAAEPAVAGTSTQFDCSADSLLLTWGVIVHAHSGGASSPVVPVDCGVWGSHPDDLAFELMLADSDLASVGCRRIEP